MRRRSVLTAWAALAAVDLAGRATYLAPRLLTTRGLLNYVLALAALFIVVRLLAMLPHRRRLAPFFAAVAVPMALEWGMFRAYGQFVEPTDIVTFVSTPKVAVLAAAGAGNRLGTLLVLVLTGASAWLLPPQASPFGRWRASGLAVVLLALVVVGASWWRASPTLEHPQPAFCAAAVGVLRQAAVRRRGVRSVVVPRAPALAAGERLPNVVLVLGESLVASHLSLYGYERDTTPKLQALANAGKVVVLRDAVVMGPHTRTSVPYIMTGLAGPDPGGRVFAAPTLLEYAKARGYHTAFLSAQEEAWGDLDAILRKGADAFHTGIELAPDVDVLKGCDDPVLLERAVLPAIGSLPEPFLLVVHMDGSHAPYTDHSRAAYKVFTEDGANSFGAYDNTIRVTDDVLSRVFAALRARDPAAWMFFTSDHGQALGEGGAFYHRGYQTNVVRDPLLAFPPDDAGRAAWSALAGAPVAACDLTPTILHLMKTTPAAGAAMDCVDLLAGPPEPRVRVVSAYTPAFRAEPTMLVLLPDGRRALYDLARGTVTMDDGDARPMAEVALPPEVAERLRVTN